MNTNQSSSAFRRFITALAVPALFVLGAGASSAQQPDRQARMAEHAERVVSQLTDELNLTASQADLIEKSLASGPQPGMLWSLAAELEPTLTDAQKTLLFTRPEWHRRGQNRPEADERHAAEQQARDRALGLSDQQSRQLDDVHDQRRAEHEQMMEQMRGNLGDRPGPGEIPADVAAILTPEQQKTVKVYHALRVRMHGPPMGAGKGPHGFGGDGPRRSR